MKRLFRLAIILFSLLIIVACGQGAELETNQVSDVALSTTSMETKELIKVSSNEGKQKDKENKDEAEETETSTENNDEVNEELDEDVTVADSSENIQSETNNTTSDDNDTETQSSHSNHSSNNKQSNTSKQTTKAKQGSKPKAKEEATPTPKSTVTVSVETPSDLNGPNLAATSVEITDGETAFAATLRALNSKGISIDYTGSGATAYVKSIGGLGEFDAGPLSGWNIYVEGIMIPRSADAYEVFNGYKIHWKYTKNYLEN